MQKTTTLKKWRLFFGKMLPLWILLAFAGSITAQPYVNGNLSTGATSSNGTAAPAGYTWSEVQAGNTSAGFGANVGAGFSLADDFTVPSGVGWNLSKLTFYAYSTGATGTTSPFNDVRIQIFNTDPSVGSPTPVFGNLTTNRFSASSDASMYRIFNATPGTTRKVWSIEANVSTVLGPGHYWIEWELGTVTAGASNFSPASTVVGTVTQAGNNAKQHDFTLGTWANLLDGTNQQDMPFRVDYSVVAAPACTPITGSVISAVNVLLTEGMDGTVPPAGWAVQNNSAPVGTTGWTQGGPLGVFPSHTGAGFISANFNNVGTVGTISNWLMTPVLNLKNGDKFSFWTRTTTGDFPDRLQVRMSQAGSSTNVGTGATGTGDFGTLLLDINPTYTATGYPITWTQFTVTVAGAPAGGVSGRMAFRYFVEDAGLLGNNSDFIGIDDISYVASGAPTVCSGATANIAVNITGGVGPYTVVYNASPGGNVTVNNYTSGTNIPVTPTANTTYTIVSVTGFDGCVGTNNTGSAMVNVTSGSTAAVLSQVTLPPVPTTLYNETFTTAIPLPAGWAQQNLSNPVGLTNWFQGNAAVFPANTPAGYIAANFNNTTGTNTISNWLFAPNVTLKNGDVVTFFTRSAGTFADRLEVRMSTAGASVNAGATNTSVGDFTTVLLDINPTLTATGYPTAWTQFSVTLSGLPTAGVSGRIAFRYFVTNGGPSGANSNYIGIDDVVYNTVAPGAPPTTCTGSTANLQVNITGGTGPYTVVIQPSTGGPITVTNYVSGTYIPVTPSATTSYTLVSVTSSIGCAGTGNSGNPTITVSATPTTPLTIVDNPTGPLCAGNPKLLTVMAGSGLTTFTAAPAAIAIPGTGSGSSAAPAPASVYPINNTVSGLPTSGVSVKSVTIRGLSHTWMSDVNMLLQSPTGQNVVILADVGQGGDYANHTLTFDDAAAQYLNNTTGGTNPPASGTTWKPTNLVDYLFPASDPDVWPAPGPGTYGASDPLSSFTGNFNGVWKMFITDDGGGDVGSITGGYDIVFSSPSAAPVGYTFLWTPAQGLSSTTTNPVAASPMQTTTYTVLGTAPNGCQTTAQITITVNQLPAVTAPPANTTVCAGGTATFTATATGAGLTYQWQVSTTGVGGPYTNVTNVAPYSGATTSTLTINPVAASMNGYAYRVVVSGTCPPAVNSAAGVLTVNPLPVITFSTTNPVCGGVAGSFGTPITASSTTGGNFIWSPATGLYTNAAATTAYVAGTPAATVYAAPAVNTTYTVTATNGTTGCVGTNTITVNYTPAAPTVTPAAASICLGGVQALTITSSLAPVTVSLTNSTPVAVPDANPAGATSVINVAGVPAGSVIANMEVAVNMTHTWTGDMVIVLKTPAPTNRILNLAYYLGGTGGAGATTGFTNTRFNPTATATLAGGTNPWNGTFRPDAFTPATEIPGFPSGPTGFTPNVTTFGALYPTGTDINGAWTLAMYDGGAGDVGTLTSWSLNFTYGVPPGGIWSPATGLYTNAAATTPYVAGTPAVTVYASPTVTTTYNVTVANGTCTSPARSVVVTVNTPVAITAQPVTTTVCTNQVATFSVTATGTNPTYQWQVSTDAGNTFTNITNDAIYSGATTNTLTITNPPVSYNNYIYRVVINGTAPCGSVTSLQRILRVNPLPTVVIAAAPYTALYPGLVTTLTSTVTPNAAATYTWLRNGAAVAGATGPTLNVDADGLGTYTLRVQDINGCVGTSNAITIRDSANGNLFIYPNPNNGVFQVRYYSVAGNTLARGITVYDAQGARVLVQNFTNTAPYSRMDLDLTKYGKGIYWIELGDRSGNRLAVGRVIVQ